MIYINYYSQDCKQWSQLADADNNLRKKCIHLQGRLTGRPEHVHEQQLVEKIGEGDSIQQKTTTV